MKPLNQLRIEKGVPMPIKYPFKDMQVGDSFAVPPDIKRSAVSVAATRYGTKLGRQFAVRLMPDRTLRCWRVA